MSISLCFKNKAFNFSECYYSQLLLCLQIRCLGINFAMNERITDHFWILVGSLCQFSLRLDVLWKHTAISLRCKNKAFNILERYCSQSLCLFLEQNILGYK